MKTRTLFVMMALAAGSFIGTSCNKSDNDDIAANANPSNQAAPPQGLAASGNWKTINTRVFTIEAPSNWNYAETPSMDTHTGLLAGGTDSIMFEYGTTMSAYQMDPENYSYHYETINKLRALVIESNGSPQRYGVAIDSVNTREGMEEVRRFILMQSSKSQMDKETAMRMIRSIKFNP